MTSRIATSSNRLEFEFIGVIILALAGGFAAFLPGRQFLDKPRSKRSMMRADAAKQVMVSLFHMTKIVLLVRFALTEAST
jgi:hypothetical protein